MRTLSLKDIEKKAIKKDARKTTIMRQFSNQLKSSDLVQGRVRPKDPVEARILSSFNRK